MEKVGFKKELRATCTRARAGLVNNAADETRNDQLQDLYVQSDDDGFMRITVQTGTHTHLVAGHWSILP